jgi:octaprenyl-diphosphate synthase
MDQTGSPHVTVPENLRAMYAPVAAELEKVENRLRSELSSDNPFVDSLVKHGFRLGGKRLRPALVLLSGKLCGGIRPAHVTLAAMVELIHTASLVHDDVLDEAAVRRHLDTINARWNNETSILLGDYLFARAMCLAASLDDVFACRLVSDSTRNVCEGEFKQIESRGNFNLTESDYYEIIGGKTAALMACCCRLGAHYAGATVDVCDALNRYGHNLGMAFQIADDVLDLYGNEEIVGKSLGTDLEKQKATLPVIRLLASVKDADRSAVDAILTSSADHHRDALRSWLERYDAISYVRAKAKWFVDRAADDLSGLPAGNARDSLLSLTEFVVTRRQ